MTSKKYRLYVTLHHRSGGVVSQMPGKEDTYCWALLVGPKTEKPESTGTRYRARNDISITGNVKWTYDEQRNKPLSPPPDMLLVRILVAKIEDMSAFEEIVRDTPVRGNDDESWNDVVWVKEALERLDADDRALSPNRVCQWIRVKGEAMSYIAGKKAQGRFDGRARERGFDVSRAPTCDLLQAKETVP